MAKYKGNFLLTGDLGLRPSPAQFVNVHPHISFTLIVSRETLAQHRHDQFCRVSHTARISLPRVLLTGHLTCAGTQAELDAVGCICNPAPLGPDKRQKQDNASHLVGQWNLIGSSEG